MELFDVEAIEAKIGYKFKDEMLLLEAFTHASYANENHVRSYERLEFLGDSILGYCVARYLYTDYPKADEGFLTKAKANIVSGKTLAQAIEKMDLIGYMRTSSGSSEYEVRNSNKKKEDLFESLVGAIACDSGYTDECWKFIKTNLRQYLELDYEHIESSDYKSALLERCRHELREAFFECEVLPDGNFKATAVIDGIPRESGIERSKKKAEQLASKATLSTLGAEKRKKK